jgi:hypothetical protein
MMMMMMGPTKLNDAAVSGIPYESAINLVETIVSMKKAKYNFPGVDLEDLGQDIRIMCWEALEQKFEPGKVGKSVFHFVARVVDNGLYNKFRGIFLDNNPPCLRCDEYIKETKGCKIDEEGCDRIKSYRDRMASKRAIAAPLSYNAFLDSEGSSDYTHHDSLSVGSTTGVCDLDDAFRTELDETLVPYYDQMISGEIDQVPPHYRRMVQKQIRLIIEDQGNE